ncbi:MAG: hypothetical protein FGM14_07235 [Flavobacteriales bacterium]|nr:hypothetical protein [Flavobacteriales bacterium]
MQVQNRPYRTIPKIRVPIRNIADYSPFGVQLDGRTIQGDFYRYGYQGSEKDDESKGGGNSYTTFYRQLDPRVGKWFSIDPLFAKFPNLTPYHSMNNNPIWFNDQKGDKPNDWIKNKSTGKFEWDSKVNKKSDTPKGFEYIGKKDVDIVNNLFDNKSTHTESTYDIGLMGSDNEEVGNVQTVAFYNGRIDTKLVVSLVPNVETKYDETGNVIEKNFKGIDVFASTVSNVSAAIPGGSAMYELHDMKFTLNGKALKKMEGNFATEVANLPSSHYTRFVSAKTIQNNFGKEFNYSLNLNGQYACVSDKSVSILMMPGALGLVEENRTKINMLIKFKNK